MARSGSCNACPTADGVSPDAGQYTDAESGLIYLRARYYDPTTAQFLSRDPAVALTQSPYGYVNGNPLDDTDPRGLYGYTFSWDIGNAGPNGAERIMSLIREDLDTGLIYLRNRYYDPSTGQMLSRDPTIAMTGSAYGYAEDNPLNLTDPSGLGAVPGAGCQPQSCPHGPAVNLSEIRTDFSTPWLPNAGTLSQVTGVLALVAYGACPLTGVTCAIGAALTGASFPLAGIHASDASSPGLSSGCAVALGQVALSLISLVAPGALALQGAHFADSTLTFSLSLWNVAIDAITGFISNAMQKATSPKAAPAAGTC